MPDGSKPCLYRAEHEWDADGLCKHCFAKKPPTPSPYGWVAHHAQQVADEPLSGSDITPERLSSRIEILNWDELLAAKKAGRVLMGIDPEGRFVFERVDQECASNTLTVHESANE